MSYDIRLPNITGTDTGTRVAQMQTYLYQLVEQLNWALNTLNSAESGDSEAKNKIVVNEGELSESEAQGTFNSLKGLIIKSADIVTAYETELRKSFDGLYVANSDFGTYSEETHKKTVENSDGIADLYKNIQTITDNTATIKKYLIDTNAYIKSGLLDYDDNGAAIYGIEIGQKDAIQNLGDEENIIKRWSRFTADKLSFYNADDKEIAWISGYKMYIKNAEFQESVKFGGYICELTDGIAFKWQGGV